LILAALALLLASAPAGEAAGPNLFVRAKDSFNHGDHEEAASLCWKYISESEPSDEKYESAQFFLARSMQELKIFHGAVEYYFQVANNRRNPELLSRTIKALEAINLAHPFDEGLIIRDLIGDTDFGDLHGELSDFIHYWQGVTNLRRGLGAWASERLSKINRRGYYFFSSLYLASIRLLHPATDADKREAVTSFAGLFGGLDLGAALEAMRRRGEGDTKLVYAIKALINDDNTINVSFSKLPKGWEVELAVLGLARTVAETRALLVRAKNTDPDSLVMPLSYLVQIAGMPIYRQSIRFEERAAAVKAVADKYDAVRRVRGKALHALARLLYEQRRYVAAYVTLGKIPRGTERVSEILLERAWSKFKAGDHHRAMGLLYALDAPVFRSLFAPEKFILRGLIYKRFCHFRAAKMAVRRFKKTYGKTMLRIRQGVPIAKIEQIKKAAQRRGQSKKLFRFLLSLRQEQAAHQKIELWHKGGLSRHLGGLYKQKIIQIKEDLKRAMAVSAKEIAQELLKAEEQVNLLEYEVGQAIFQRVSDAAAKGQARKRAAKIPLSSRRIYYPFVGEYWTGELPYYKFNIEDRCVD